MARLICRPSYDFTPPPPHPPPNLSQKRLFDYHNLSHFNYNFHDLGESSLFVYQRSQAADRELATSNNGRLLPSALLYSVRLALLSDTASSPSRSLPARILFGSVHADCSYACGKQQSRNWGNPDGLFLPHRRRWRPFLPELYLTTSTHNLPIPSEVCLSSHPAIPPFTQFIYIYIYHSLPTYPSSSRPPKALPSTTITTTPRFSQNAYPIPLCHHGLHHPSVAAIISSSSQRAQFNVRSLNPPALPTSASNESGRSAMA